VMGEGQSATQLPVAASTAQGIDGTGSASFRQQE
jgi:hypothetical protein